MVKKLYLFSIFLCAGIFTAVESAEPGMPQLNTKYWMSQIIWLILIFSVLFLVIWKIILPKITNNIENRKANIMGNLNEAENLKKIAENKLSDYKKIITESANEAKKIILENKQKINSEISVKKANFEKEIENEILNAEKQMKDLKKSSFNEINSIAKESTKEIVKELIGTEVNSSSLSTIVENASKKRMEKYL